MNYIYTVIKYIKFNFCTCWIGYESLCRNAARVVSEIFPNVGSKGVFCITSLLNIVPADAESE